MNSNYQKKLNEMNQARQRLLAKAQEKREYAKKYLRAAKNA